MRVIRLLLYLVTLILVVALSGCGRSAASQDVMMHPMLAKTATSTVAVSTVLPTRRPDLAANPARLIIPAIGVNAHIELVGILSNGDMATPRQNQWENVGWYNAGPRPGERGSAVIDGHLDRPGGYPAVFWRLRDLHVGDEVSVMNLDGKTLHFYVRRIELYPPQAAPFQDIFGNKGGTYLNLITCAGDWIPSQRQTTLRLVVYTALA